MSFRVCRSPNLSGTCRQLIKHRTCYDNVIELFPPFVFNCIDTCYWKKNNVRFHYRNTRSFSDFLALQLVPLLLEALRSQCRRERTASLRSARRAGTEGDEMGHLGDSFKSCFLLYLLSQKVIYCLVFSHNSALKSPGSQERGSPAKVKVSG